MFADLESNVIKIASGFWVKYKPKMKFNITLGILCILTTQTVNGQLAQTDTLAKREMQKLAFLTGEWEGTGWMIGPDREKHSFDQTEKIHFKLDSTLILIEGKGMSEDQIVHNALAIISYDRDAGHYIFNSWLANGRKGEFKAELIGGKLYWYLNDMMRYIISINENGQWYETGEMHRNGNWFQFFEMTLDMED